MNLAEVLTGPVVVSEKSFFKACNFFDLILAIPEGYLQENRKGELSESRPES